MLGGLGVLGGGLLLAAQVVLHGLQHRVARNDVRDLVELVRRLQHRLQVVLEPAKISMDTAGWMVASRMAKLMVTP